MHTASLLYRCRDALREIANDDLAAEQIYLVDRAQLDDRFDVHRSGCQAWTSTALDLFLFPHLHKTNQWLGRGFAAILYVDTLLAHNPSLAESADALFGQLLATSIHELGHHLERPMQPTCGEIELGMFNAEDLQRIDSVLVQINENQQPAPVDAPPAWYLHERRFIRSVAHLWSRATELGYDIPFHGLSVGGSIYGLSSGAGYVAHLFDDIKQYRHWRIRDLLDQPEPTGFKQQWVTDTQCHLMGV